MRLSRTSLAALFALCAGSQPAAAQPAARQSAVAVADVQSTASHVAAPYFAALQSDGVQPTGFQLIGVQPAGVHSTGVQSNSVQSAGVQPNGVQSTEVHSASAHITVDRETVTLNPRNANEHVATLRVRNTGTTMVRLAAQFEDWEVDAQGASHWRKSGAVAGSCGRRVSLSPSALKLAPGDEGELRVSLNPGAQFDAECWSAAVIRTVNTVNPGIDTTSAFRTAVPLYVTPSGLTVDGELSDMYVKGDSLEVIFRNTGKLRTTIVGEIQVQSADNSVVTTVPLDSATVLVGATRRFRVAMPKLPHGQYLLVALVDFGGEQLTAVQAALDMR